MTLKWQPPLHSTPPLTLHPISPCSSPEDRKLPEGSNRSAYFGSSAPQPPEQHTHWAAFKGSALSE